MTKPIYLLADSQLLFQTDDNGVAHRIRADLSCGSPKAAYIGASNGDNMEFYGIFTAAMRAIEVSHCRMVPAQLAPEDRGFLHEADLIVLAGGDVERGWRVFEQNGLKDLILSKRYKNTTLVGVSAGAVQLGLGTLTQAEHPETLNLFGFAPFYIGAHEEINEWYDLRVLINLAQPPIRGIGLRAGGGAVYWPDGTLEPIRRPLIELAKCDNQIHECLLLPLDPGAAGG